MLMIILLLICVCQATQHTNSDFLNPEHDQVEVLSFEDVEYLFFGYQVTFDEACVICLNYGAQLAVLNTREKTKFVARNTLELGESWIGAQSDDGNLWYWNDKNRRFNVDQTFYGELSVWDSPRLISNNENCLSIFMKRHSIPVFVPLQCFKKRPFICEREIDRFGIKAKEVDVIKVDDEEYTLYSAKATWAEAVVQCRQKRLQIAEVKSKRVAQAVATSMIRVRPDAMENVWIGGHSKDDVWEWVASNNKISFNELWSNDTKLSTGCLLLDRHGCRDPIYISAKCDRRRNILCQKPLVKSVSKSLVPIDVHGCPYWIGFYPLKWLDAERSCQTMNASLVILGSPLILNHMMNLMVDHKQELRHIWTNGYRKQRIPTARKKSNKAIWYWASTGDRIPESDFIPWCPVYYDNKDENCMNLDRENHKTPVVYGLNCGKNQTYVCQPWKGHCVSHRVQEDLLKNPELTNLYSTLASKKPVKTPAIASSQNSSKETGENVSYIHEDISEMKKSHSTESYYTSSMPYSIAQQVTYLLEKTTESTGQETSTKSIDRKNVLKSSGYKKGKSDDKKEAEVNQTNSQNSFTEFFSPLIQFTLPSLPQFGIRVVSAEVTTPKSEVRTISSERPKFKATTATVASTTKITQVINNKNNEIHSKARNRTLGSVQSKNILRNKKRKPVAGEVTHFKNLPVTTEMIETVSPGNLYGDNIDYYDTLSSKATEIIERREESQDYEKLLKSINPNDSLSFLKDENIRNFTSKVDISSILQKVIGEELEMLKQSKEKNDLARTRVGPDKSLQQEKSHSNIFSGVESEPKNGKKNIRISPYRLKPEDFEPVTIPPYYAFDAPLKVEILDDGSEVSFASVGDPEVGEERMKFEPQASENNQGYIDFESKKFDPHDKDSMLQLGRFLKDVFVRQNPNAQTVDFNLIARRNSPEAEMETQNNESLIHKNHFQRDIKAQNDSTNFTLQSTGENQDFVPCQEIIEPKIPNPESPSSTNLDPEYLQHPCKGIPVSVPSGPFRIPRRSPGKKNGKMKKEDDEKNHNPSENGEINQKNDENEVKEDMGGSLFDIFKDLVKGIRIDIKEAQLKTYVSKFVQTRLSNPGKYDFDTKSGTSWHKAFKKILNSLNGTAIRFHGERVQLRIGSFGYKQKSKPKSKVVDPVEIQKPSFRESDEQVMKNSAMKKIHRKEESRNSDEVQVRRKLPWTSSESYKTELEGSYPKRTIDRPLNKTQYKKQHFKNPPGSETDPTMRNRSNMKRKKQKSTTESWPYLKNVRGSSKKEKMFSPSEEYINKTRNLPSEQSLEEDGEALEISNRLTKKSISEANDGNPFPDFPVINFDMRRAEDSIENGFEPIRVSRAIKRVEYEDKLTVVSVYIILKHQDYMDDQNTSIPILELHVRMPANSEPQKGKSSSDSRTRSISGDRISNFNALDKMSKNPASENRKTEMTEKTSVTDNVEPTKKSRKSQSSQKTHKHGVPKQKKVKNPNSENPGLDDGKNQTDLNYKRANDFIKNIIENVTNTKNVPNLKRKRQLLYLALKYLRTVTDEPVGKQSGRIGENLSFPGGKQNVGKKEIGQFLQNPNLRPPEIQNSWSPMFYPGLENRPVIFNPLENELNPRPGLFNQMPNFNYNTRRYDDMPYGPVNARMRRNSEISSNSRSRLFFVDRHQALDRN